MLPGRYFGSTAARPPENAIHRKELRVSLKLFHAAASPFARKVVVAAHERGIAGQLELIPAAPSQVRRDEAVARHNPAGKIPCAVLPDGEPMFDSRVITAWVDANGISGPALYPDAPGLRFRVLTLEALGDAIMDAAILIRAETVLRPEPLRWDDWTAGQVAKIAAAADALEGPWAELLDQGFHAGSISAACALAYLDFRLPELGWREGRERLAAWHAKAAGRPSIAATSPAA